MTPWNERLEVQGFASPVWVDANGISLGTAAVVASTVARTITIALPKTTFGTPTSGWSFAEVLTGQDGFSSDQARAFTPTPGGYSFGVCAAGNTRPDLRGGPDDGARRRGRPDADRASTRRPNSTRGPDPW